jgi:hypothetical protein
MTLPVLQFRVSRKCCDKETILKETGTILVASNDRPNTNGNRENSKHYSGPAFKARPMKHYRKRLIPNSPISSTRTTMRPLEAPGGSIYNNSDNICNTCNGLVYHRSKL